MDSAEVITPVVGGREEAVCGREREELHREAWEGRKNDYLIYSEW